MNYRIDFIDNTNYTVQHSLNFNDGLDKIRINADKIAGVSYFAKEPKRIEFECFKDEWIEDNILSGNYELDRYISTYFVRVYENNNLIFHGIIDTSFISYNAKTNIVNFTCYDYLKLFSKFSDIEMLYALMQGYNPGYCFGYMVQGIELLLGITIAHTWSSGWSPLNIQKTDLQILDFKWRDIISKFDSWNGNLTIQSGFLLHNLYIPEFRILIFKEHQQESNGKNYKQIKIYGRRYRFYNNICFYHISDDDIDDKTEVYDEDHFNELDDEFNSICEKYYTSTDWIGNDTLMINNNTYNFIINPEDLPSDDYDVPEDKYLNFTGNIIPYNVFPKGFYELGGKPTNRLRVLKTVLMLHNLTIISQIDGRIKLVNKNEANSAIIAVESSDIIEFKRKRLNRSIPDTSILDLLLGDTTILKNLISVYYEEYFNQIWEINIIIDNLSKYAISLFDKIQVNGILYKVTEIKRDSKKDEYQIKAWQL